MNNPIRIDTCKGVEKGEKACFFGKSLLHVYKFEESQVNV